MLDFVSYLYGILSIIAIFLNRLRHPYPPPPKFPSLRPVFNKSCAISAPGGEARRAASPAPALEGVRRERSLRGAGRTEPRSSGRGPGVLREPGGDGSVGENRRGGGMQQERLAGRAQPAGRTMLLFNLEKEFEGCPASITGGSNAFRGLRKKKKERAWIRSLHQTPGAAPASLFPSQGCKFSLDVKAEAASIQGRRGD